MSRIDWIQDEFIQRIKPLRTSKKNCGFCGLMTFEMINSRVFEQFIYHKKMDD